MGWAGHAANAEERVNACRFVVGKHEG